MEGLGSRAWKSARLPGSLSPKPGVPQACHSSPCVGNGERGALDLLRKRGLGLSRGGQDWPAWTWPHLCRADLGPHSLGVPRELVGRTRAGRPPCLPTMVSLPIWCLLEAPFSPHCRPICEPRLWGNRDAGLVGRLAGSSWGRQLLGVGGGWSSAGPQPPGSHSCF